MSDAIQAELVKALPGALLGLLPITLTAFFDWQEKRDIAEKRNQAIDTAHRRVIFLADWVKAHESCTTEQLSQIKQEVSNELNQLKKELAKALAAQEHRKTVKYATRVKRGFLQNLFLAYAPRSAFAWLLHILYYMMLGISALLFLSGGFASDNPDVWDWSAFGYIIVGTVVLFFPPMALIHWWARLADRRVRRAAQEEQIRLEKLEYDHSSM